MAVDALDGLHQLALVVRLAEATHRDSGGARISVTGREERRNSVLLGHASKLNAVALAAQADVAEDQIDLLARDDLERIVELIDRRDDLISRVAEDILIVECRQRFILDDEDALDDLLTLPEQHPNPMTSRPQRTNRKPVPQASRSRAPAPREGGPQRIAKLLARAGVASRREVERMIAEGHIALNGENLTTPATLLENLDGVTVDGKPVRPAAATRLFRFYKPDKTLTAERDPRGRPTIYDRIPPGLPRVMPVGRLDFMTEGLLLLTNDGELKRKLELPRTAVVRTYRARAHGHVTQAQLESLADGITIDGIHYGSINANLERRTGSNCWIEMSLTEGKNREVRRVLAHLGLQVSRLIRVAYGPLTLEGLEPGDADEVSQAVLETFAKSLK